MCAGCPASPTPYGPSHQPCGWRSCVSPSSPRARIAQSARSVTAPRLAEATERTYLPSTTRVATGARGAPAPPRPPGLAPPLDHGPGHLQLDPPRVRVDRDGIALVHQRDQAAHGRLRRDVPDHQAVRAAREAAAGDEPARVAQARADERRRGREHLAHPRPAPRALVADHD